jgi:hypothetical protein
MGLGLLTYPLPLALQLLALGVGFGGLHLAFGIYIGSKVQHGRTL